LLDQLGNNPERHRREFEVVQTTVRDALPHQVANCRSAVVADVALPGRGDELGESVGQEVVLVGALLCDDSFDQDSEAVPVAATLGLYEVKEQICACHRAAPLS